MIIKEVKEYGTKTKRQRIEFTKSDGLSPGSEVVILTVEEYDKLKNKIFTMNDKVISQDKELQIYQNQEQNLKQIIEDTTSPIHEYYKQEIKSKDDRIKQLEDEYKTLQDNANQFNLELMGLNGLEILFLRKHKKLIRSFHEDLKLIGVDTDIVDTNVLPGVDRSGSDKNQKWMLILFIINKNSYTICS